MMKRGPPSPRGSTSRRRRGANAEPLELVVDSSDVNDTYVDATLDDPAYTAAKRTVNALKRDFDFNCLVGYALTVSALIVVFLMCTQLVWKLPSPLPPDSAPEKFAEGRAWVYLTELQSHGPSLVGTKSNVAVADYIVSALKSIQSQVEDFVAKGMLKRAPTFEIEVQRPSGALNFDLLGFTLTNHYTRLHNVVVRMSWDHHFSKDPNFVIGKNKALLINSHFDSGVSSPGAMDARACNALMLELVRSLANAENALHHPIIFLFNGAEESLQEGSHGFIAKHRWRDTVGSILNFDAGGIGGPQILFQVGSGEYAELFAKTAPRLHGSILAQELFDTGLLQGDTDYRIFRDFGDIHGLDLAWYRDGYKYHTPRDDLSFVEEGSLQHAGDNAFAYISAICSNTTSAKIWRDDALKMQSDPTYKADQNKPLPDLLNAYPSRSQIIFYDFLSLITLHYTPLTATIIHFFVIAAIFGLCFGRVSLRSVLSSIASVALANTIGVVGVLVVALWMTITGKAISWFTNQWVIATLYIPPLMLGWILVHYYRTGRSLKSLFSIRFDDDDSNYSRTNGNRDSKKGEFESLTSHSKTSATKSWQQLEYETIHGVSGSAALILLIGTLIGAGSVYFWLWIAMGCVLSLAAIRVYGLPLEVAKAKGKSMIPFWVYLLNLPGTCVVMQVMIQILAMAFPLSGRMPPDVPIELVIGVVFTMLIATCIVAYQPLVHRFHRYRGMMKVVLLLIVVGVIIGSLSFPFSPYRPKRVTIQHSVRAAPFPGHPTLDEPAVLFALCDAGTTGNMIDRLTELDSRGVTPHRDVHDWDSVFPVATFLTGYSLPAPPPALRIPTAQIINDTWDASLQERRMTVQVNYDGCEWSTLKFLGPLKKWNLTDTIPPYSMPSGYHIIRHIGEHKLTTWAVELTFGDNKAKRLDLSCTHFVSTPVTQLIIQMLPDWTAPTVFTTSMSHIDLDPIN